MHEFVGFPDDQWPVIVLWRHFGTWTKREEDLVRGRVARIILTERNCRHGYLLVLFRRQAGRKRFISLFGKQHHTYLAIRAKTWVGDKTIRGEKVPGRHIDFEELGHRLEKVGAREMVARSRHDAKKPAERTAI